jgi:hypothetical protein
MKLKEKQIEMGTFSLRISETKRETITYAGYSIDECYVFTFEDGLLYYVPKNRLELYKQTGKLI